MTISYDMCSDSTTWFCSAGIQYNNFNITVPFNLKNCHTGTSLMVGNDRKKQRVFFSLRRFLQWSTSETQFPIKVETCYIRMQQCNAIFIFRKRKKWPKKQFQFSILLVWPTWFPKCLFNADKRTEVFFSPKAVKSFCAVLSRSLCLQPECRPLFFSRLPFVGVRLKGKRFRVYGPKCGSTLI